MTHIIELPWPSRKLHPNARVHWAVKAKATKAARDDAMVMAASAKLWRVKGDKLNVHVTFHPPDRRKRDTDGMLSSCKAYFDGIADVVGIDDSEWEFSMSKGDPCPQGLVRIQIEGC